MTTKKYASKKAQVEATRFDKRNPCGSKMKKRAERHNLDGTKQFSLITQTFNQMKKDKREIARANG